MIRKDKHTFLSYRDRNFRSYRKRILLVVGSAVFVIAVCFLLIGINKTISAVASIGNSIFKIKRSVGESVDNGLELAKSKSTLISEKSDLEEQVKNLETQLAGLPTLKDENAKLTEILARKKENTQLVEARILAKPNESVYDTLIVDAGSAEGIVVGKKSIRDRDSRDWTRFASPRTLPSNGVAEPAA